MDFGTVDKRRAACAAEIVRNTPTAPSIYRRAVPITCRAPAGLELGGDADAMMEVVDGDARQLGLLPDAFFPATASTASRKHRAPP